MPVAKKKMIGIRFDSVTQLERIKSAARLSGRPWTSFIRESAVAAAEAVLVEEIAERVLGQEKSA